MLATQLAKVNQDGQGPAKEPPFHRGMPAGCQFVTAGLRTTTSTVRHSACSPGHGVKNSDPVYAPALNCDDWDDVYDDQEETLQSIMNFAFDEQANHADNEAEEKTTKSGNGRAPVSTSTLNKNLMWTFGACKELPTHTEEKKTSFPPGNFSIPEDNFVDNADPGDNTSSTEDPDTYSNARANAYHCVIKSCAHNGDVNGAESLLKQMLSEGHEAAVITYNSVIHTCTQAGDPERAEKYLDVMEQRGVEPNLVTYNSVINACAAHGDTARAWQCLLRMAQRNVTPNSVTYGTICKVFARRGDVNEIERIMETLERTGIPLNEYFFASLISACGVVQPPDIARAEKALEDLVRRGLRAQSVKRALSRVVGERRTRQLIERLSRRDSHAMKGSAKGAAMRQVQRQKVSQTRGKNTSNEAGKSWQAHSGQPAQHNPTDRKPPQKGKDRATTTTRNAPRANGRSGSGPVTIHPVGKPAPPPPPPPQPTTTQGFTLAHFVLREDAQPLILHL